MVMKKFYLLLFIFICFSCSSNKKETLNSFSITGSIKNLPDSTFVILKTPKASGFTNVDSTYVINQSFNLSSTKKSKEGDLYYIDLKEKEKTLFSFKFWNDKNSISIQGNFNQKKNIRVINSNLNNLIKEYDTIMTYYGNELTKILDTTKDKQKRSEAFNEAFRLITEGQIDFLFAHYNNPFSLNEAFRFTKQISKDSLSLYYSSLDKTLQETTKGQFIKQYLSNTEVQIGQYLKDFEARNINGDVVKLSDFNDKIIILDFWAYWCKWCHVQNEKEFPYLNEKYKKDVVLISYSLDEKIDVWKKSVAKSSYKWVNLSNLKGINDPISYSYGVNELPHTFIIDKRGIVQNEFVGYKKDSLIEKEIIKLINKVNVK